MPTNVGQTQLPTRAFTAEERWQAFDALPVEFRIMLAEAPIAIAAPPVLRMLHKDGAKVTKLRLLKFFERSRNENPAYAIDLTGIDL